MTEVISTETKSGTEPFTWFTKVTDSTQEHWDRLMEEDQGLHRALASNVTDHLRLLAVQDSSFHVTRLEHCLESATMAYNDNRDDEYITMCLLHDIGDTLGCYNHPDIAAAIIKPFARDDYHWMIQHHAIFQGYYFFHFVGGDRNLRDQYAEHEHYDLTAEFVELYDMPAFDPNYKIKPLEEFTPLLEDFFRAPRAQREGGQTLKNGKVVGGN